jgi:hypothetical protein
MNKVTPSLHLFSIIIIIIIIIRIKELQRASSKKRIAKAEKNLLLIIG